LRILNHLKADLTRDLRKLVKAVRDVKLAPVVMVSRGGLVTSVVRAKVVVDLVLAVRVLAQVARAAQVAALVRVVE
jgi:hypothetical protein